MSTSQPWNWQSHPFSIERTTGKAPGTVIFRFSGPFTARDMYGTLTPLELRKLFELQAVPGEPPAVVNILDLTNVPYMDSSGLGMVVTHHVHCQNRGIKMIAAASTPRVMELFKMTKVDNFLNLAPTVDEADS